MDHLLLEILSLSPNFNIEIIVVALVNAVHSHQCCPNLSCWLCDLPSDEHCSLGLQLNCLGNCISFVENFTL